MHVYMSSQLSELIKVISIHRVYVNSSRPGLIIRLRTLLLASKCDPTQRDVTLYIASCCLQPLSAGCEGGKIA